MCVRVTELEHEGEDERRPQAPLTEAGGNGAGDLCRR